jgi:peptidyl-prolyl cis-trans isomerase D
MAVIGKIREKSGLLVFIVGLGLLLFIIPFNEIIQKFQGTGEQPIGEINGEEMMDSDWNFNARSQNMFQGYGNIPDDYRIQQETQLWNQMIIDTLLKTEVNKIGLQVGQIELNDYLILGDYPDDQLKEQFSFELTPGGEKVFRKDSVKKWYDRLVTETASLQGDQAAQQKRAIYQNIESPFKVNRLKKKYNAMAKYAVIATNSETTKSLIEKNASLDVSFVAKDINTIPDSSVVVSNADIKSYYEKHKNEVKWKIEDDYRSFDYVLIDIVPTEVDKENIMKNLDKVKTAFSNASNDTSFVMANSDTKIGATQQNPQALDVMPAGEFDQFQSAFPIEVNTQITNAKKGDVVGPFAYTGQDGISKVILVKVRDSYSRNETEVRHILIGTKAAGLEVGVNDKEIAAQAKLADSIANVLRADNSKFALLATQFTDDKQGFAQNKGYYNVYPEAGLVPEFKNFALEGNVGDIKSVKTDYGYHVMEITKRGDFSHNFITLIDKEVKPSKETKMIVFEMQGLAFMDAAQKNFENAASEFNLEAGKDEIRLSYPLSRDLGYVKSLVEWSFAEGRKSGEVSTPIETKDGKYLVAKLKAVANYGSPSFDAVKERMEKEVLKTKKIAYVKNLVKNVKTLEEATTLLAGTGISENVISLDMDNFPGMGATDNSRDPKAIAKTFLIKNTNEVNIIEGDQGVYVVMVKSKNFTPAPTEIAEQKQQLTTERQNYVESNLVLSLFKMADVKDWRMKSQIAYSNQNK